MYAITQQRVDNLNARNAAIAGQLLLVLHVMSLQLLLM